MDQDQMNSSRKITLQIRVLTILVTLNLIATIILGVAPSLFATKLNQQLMSHSVALPEDAMNDFSEFPLTRKIEVATVILRTEYQKINGRDKCIIAEILKQQPGIRFYYKVGDEYPELGDMRDKDPQGETGQIAFFLGNPASMRYATSYSKDRTGSLGNISIDEFREMVKAHPSKRS